MSNQREGLRLHGCTLSDIDGLLQKMTTPSFYCSATLYHGVDVQKGQFQKLIDVRARKSTDMAAQIICGDFGRVFDKHSELRWQYQANGKYDVLILTDDQSSFPSLAKIGTWDIVPITYYAKHGKIRALRCVNQDSGHTQFVCFYSFEESKRAT